MSSFLNSLQHLVQGTQNLVDGSGGLCMPSIVLRNGMGIDIETDLSLQGVVNTILDSASNVRQAAQIGVCAVGAAINPEVGMSLIADIFDSIATVAADVMETITDAIAGQIEAILQETIGSVFAIVEALLTLLQALVNIINTIGQIIDHFKSIGDISFKDFWDAERCEGLLASIAACYLNKLLGPLIDDFQNEALNTISEVGGDLNERITKNFDDAGTVRMYLEQENKLLKKANTQLKGVCELI